MACYFKVSFVYTRYDGLLIAKRDRYLPLKFKVLVQIGRLKPDIQIILQSWPKGFETFPFSRVFICMEFVANRQNNFKPLN